MAYFLTFAAGVACTLFIQKIQRDIEDWEDRMSGNNHYFDD